MPQAHSFYQGHSFHEGHTWRSIREQIGQDLRENYEVPKELPRKLLTLVRKLDDWPTPLWSELHNRPPRSSKSWLAELTAEWAAMQNTPQAHPNERSAYKPYRRKQIAELRPYVPGENMLGISVSEADKLAGSPRRGDMIARNPKNYKDQWLVAAQYFADNFDPA